MKTFRLNVRRMIPLLLILGALALTTSALVLSQHAFSTTVTNENEDVTPLAQFTSQGHLLGFQSAGVVISNATYALRVEFVGANALPPRADSFTQSSDTLSPLTRVTYANVWNGITLTYDAPEGSILRSTYTLAPFARAETIRLRYNAPLTLNSNGTLSTAYAAGQVTESAPLAWQEQNGQRIPVEVEFVMRGEREVGFALGEYDPRLALVIDPVLTWNTFLGGGGYDVGYGIAVDASSNVYVTGFSEGGWGTPIRDYSGGEDAFVAKLDASGALIWNTFLGSDSPDAGFAVAADGSGNSYVIGYSGQTWGTPVRAHAGSWEAFAAKLDSNGNLTWNTFLGGSSNDYGKGISVDGNGNVYVAGDSWATWGAPVRSFTDNPDPNGISIDAFAVKLDTSGALVWNTFLGSPLADLGNGIVVDGSANVYMVGGSNATWGAPVRAFSELGDAFAAKLDSNGALTWNTFLGGSLPDSGKGVTVDTAGRLYVAGVSAGTWGTPVRPFTDFNDDTFAAKLESSGALTWNTFLGGKGWEGGGEIAVGGQNVYVSGYGNRTWGKPLRPFTNDVDVFAVKLDGSGGLTWNTFLGGGGWDGGGGSSIVGRRRDTAIAVDRNGNAYVTGFSRVTWGKPVRAFVAHWDVFVAKLPSTPDCNQKPENPYLLKPFNTTKVQGPDVNLDWANTACAKTYDIVVKEGSKRGSPAFEKQGSTKSKAVAKGLIAGTTYFWRVTAVNEFGKSSSRWLKFKVR